MVDSDHISELKNSNCSSDDKTNLKDPIDVHTTKWATVNLFKFSALIAVSSTVENAVFYPFYVLKTREQGDRRNLSLVQSFRYHLRSTLSKSNTNTRTPSLYRGFWFSNNASLPAYGLYLGVYIASKDYFSESTNISARFYAPFIAGAIADVVSVFFYVPGDVIAQRLQLENSPYKSSSHAIRSIYKEAGIKGYYAGLGATFIVSALASSIWWMAYENVKILLYKPSILPYFVWKKSTDDTKNEIHRGPQIAAGYIAGTITSTCVNPLDVVKTRIQIQPISHSGTTKPHTIYKNIFHGLKCLWNEEGLRGCFRGIFPKLLSRGPLSALSALVFELVLHYSRDDLN